MYTLHLLQALIGTYNMYVPWTGKGFISNGVAGRGGWLSGLEPSPPLLKQTHFSKDQKLNEYLTNYFFAVPLHCKLRGNA